MFAFKLRQGICIGVFGMIIEFNYGKNSML